MGDKLWFLIPEIILLVGVVLVAVMGLSPRVGIRRSLGFISVGALIIAGIVTTMLYEPDRVEAAGQLLPMIGKYISLTVAGVGILLLLLSTGMIDQTRERMIAAGRAVFDPLCANRGEYHAFVLLSLAGVMLTCSANDLIWLFLALELTSLPTYIMVAMSRSSRLAQEAAMKYFFLGAMSAAMFLYGFALLYGATGTIELSAMREVLAEQAASGGLNPMAIAGIVLALMGMGFKIAAAPMHFYAPDVYEGAAAPVTAFLGFVPKAAGFIAIMLLLSTVGWEGHLADGAHGLPPAITIVLWVMAVLTMTLGNIGALLQSSVKRMLGYSSIAHSGYMLMGIIAGPGAGFTAVLFYLAAYGVMNTAAFSVLCGLARNGKEIEGLDDLAGLRTTHPVMAVVLALSAGSLLGLPPLLGFWGKIFLFVAVIDAGHLPLVVIAGLNTAISAWYYLRLVAVPIMRDADVSTREITSSSSPWPGRAGVICAVLIVIVPIPGILGGVYDAAEEASHIAPPRSGQAETTPDSERRHAVEGVGEADDVDGPRMII
jgi:NADH-quinone oxidoreductase subunit N